MTVSRDIHVSANGSFVPFNGEVIFLAIVYMWRIVFIYSPVDKYLGCFHVLVIVKSAAINIGVHVFLEIMVLCPSGVAESYGRFPKDIILFFAFVNKVYPLSNFLERLLCLELCCVSILRNF